jgi:hypothetical protein
MNAQGLWTLDELVTKIQNDLELHGDTFVVPLDIKSYINDAIDDAEQIIIDLFSDFFLTFTDLIVEKDQTIVDLPQDMYESRIRGIYYNETGWTTGQTIAAQQRYYKIKKLALEYQGYVQTNVDYQYRLINTSLLQQKIYFFPAIDEASTDKFRFWYIRRAKRLDQGTDLLEKGLRPQYILARTKCAIMQKEGDPAYESEKANWLKQEEAMISSLSRTTDDDEDSYLYPDTHALNAAYGDWE